MSLTKEQALAGAYLRLVAAGIVPPATIPEYFRFLAGFRRLFRVFVSRGQLDRAQSALSSAGRCLQAMPVSTCHLGGSWTSLVADEFGKQPDGYVIGLGYDAKLVADLLGAERDSAEMAGKLLEYPECCVAAYSRYADAGESWSSVLVRQAMAGPYADPATARANRLPIDWGGISPVGEMFPCALNCAEARRIGTEGWETMNRLGLSALACRLVQDATRPCRIVDGRATLCASDADGSIELSW